MLVAATVSLTAASQTVLTATTEELLDASVTGLRACSVRISLAARSKHPQGAMGSHLTAVGWVLGSAVVVINRGLCLTFSKVAGTESGVFLMESLQKTEAALQGEMASVQGATRQRDSTERSLGAMVKGLVVLAMTALPLVVAEEAPLMEACTVELVPMPVVKSAAVPALTGVASGWTAVPSVVVKAALLVASALQEGTVVLSKATVKVVMEAVSVMAASEWVA